MASEERVIAEGAWHAEGSSHAVKARLVDAGDRIACMAVATEGAPGRMGTGDGPAGEGVPPALASAPFSSLQIWERIGRLPRRIAFPDGSVFETADNDAIDALMTARGRRGVSFVHRLERFHPRLILLAAGTFLLGGAVYRYALPLLVEIAVLVTPPVVPQIMAKSTLETLDRTVFDASRLDAETQARLTEGFRELAAEGARGAEGYTLNFRTGGAIGPNAFALPDGTLVMTDELVALADGDEEMLFGVLAHEIGHVDLKHSLRQLYRAAGVAGLIMLIAGDVGSGIEDLLTQGAGLVALSYSREAESEADRYSVTLMRQAGKDPAALARFFVVLSRKLGDTGNTSILSTHPGSPERRKAIEDLAKGATGS
ncbi:Peptidase family M48 [Rhizobium sp. RU20A]|uniref:M48 family metallopeptidase n=1 Tax=Rhizobium sp. RU20A TaxID=1907412 RepID=UPI000953B85A|nr:M48 family metallopeptidase [Rhizobium sp. RU20A]SIQ53323.1 Peptidase family M48 [Rhizobium sp. RU20A]